MSVDLPDVRRALRGAGWPFDPALHVVAIWGGEPSEIFAGLLRHELEHCRQFDAHPTASELHDTAFDLMIELGQQVPHSNRIYNQMPMEADANAAAGAFLRTRFGDIRIDELAETGGGHIQLFRRQPAAPPIDDLVERMDHFIEALPDIVAAMLPTSEPPSPN